MVKEKKKNSNYYADPDKFLEELKRYVEKRKENPNYRMNDILGKMILDTINGFSFNYKYRGYPYREEMVSYAIERMLKGIHKFDFDKYDNVHTFVTNGAERSFWQVIHKEKKHLYTKFKIQMNNGSILNSSDDTNASVSIGNTGDYSAINKFIDDFENSDNFKKLKKK